ncbi:MAG: prolyl oligopeptidase family serine peptidase [Planctomycetes bacterium]|nr:prolyl oligopeptidase family serine peptidase [Planctomycetota bacterium]
MRIRDFFVVLPVGPAALLLASLAARAQEPEDPPPEIRLVEGLMIPALGSSGRSPVRTDALEAKLVAETWTAPAAGDKISLPGGKEVEWKSVRADEKGVFSVEGFAGGWAYFKVAGEDDEVVLLEASGHALVYVNGELRAGDPYCTGWLALPVELRQGDNDFLFRLGRRPLTAKLVRVDEVVSFSDRDRTLPHAIAGEALETWAGVVVRNATLRQLQHAHILVTVGSGEPSRIPVPGIPPLGTRKVALPLKGPAPAADAKTVAVELELVLADPRRRRMRRAGTTRLELEVCRPDQPHRRTFLSEMDGSVQYYAVNPATKAAGNAAKALVLSLHGASVEALNQAKAYSPKDWCHIVAPTNRRPFGFDWEDWGRLDALEVLADATKRLGADPRRIYLTGHSMGGHGAWHLGVTFPDRFAAVGPSAGWISFWSYGGAQKFEGAGIPGMLRRATSPSDTLALVSNLAPRPVYVLHGDKDDNVPVAQAREMKKALEAFHRNFVYHEQPGAGHWWDASAEEPGTSCVDWPPMFELFRKQALPEPASVREIDFATACPAVSARFAWLTVELQERPLVPSRVRIRFDPEGATFEGTTENVARLALDLKGLGKARPLTIALDGKSLAPVAWPVGAEARLWLARKAGGWSVAPKPGLALKGPHRYGPFKEAFRHRMVLVYATDGTDEENAWALQRARYDAETFGYRGNGSVDVMADVMFRPEREQGRNVILYGNAENNAAWQELLGACPVQVTGGEVRIGERVEKGDDLGCLFVWPRPGTDSNLVGVVSGSGLKGLRLTDRLPCFVSGVSYPDLLLVGAEMLERGLEGVRAAGFFGPDWSVAHGEIAWR